MSAKRLLSIGNCPLCDAEQGQPTNWGISPDGYEAFRRAHEAGHPPASLPAGETRPAQPADVCACGHVYRIHVHGGWCRGSKSHFGGGGMDYEHEVSGSLCWDAAHISAIRFARREDAMRVLGALRLLSRSLPYDKTLPNLRPDDEAPRVVEHMWIKGALRSASPSPGRNE